MILPQTVQIHQKKINSNQDKIISKSYKIADCRYSLNNITSYNTDGETLSYDGSLHCQEQLNPSNIVSFDGKEFFELEDIKDTVDLGNDFLFCYCKLRKTNFVI